MLEQECGCLHWCSLSCLCSVWSSRTATVRQELTHYELVKYRSRMKILFIIPVRANCSTVAIVFATTCRLLRSGKRDMKWFLCRFIFRSVMPFIRLTRRFSSRLRPLSCTKVLRKRKMPSWLRKISDSDRMLKMASSLSGTTSAEGMGVWPWPWLRAMILPFVNRCSRWLIG